MIESNEINIFQDSNFFKLPIHLKILKINGVIESFPIERKIDICENCRKKNGDFKKYNTFLQDTNTCSLCFKKNDLINYSIHELVELSGLDANDYYNYVDEKSNITYNGLRSTRTKIDQELYELDLKNELLKLYEKFQPYVYNLDENIRQLKYDEFRKDYRLIDLKYHKYDFFAGDQFIILSRAFSPYDSKTFPYSGGNNLYIEASLLFLKYLRNMNLTDSRIKILDWILKNKMN